MSTKKTHKNNEIIENIRRMEIEEGYAFGHEPSFFRSKRQQTKF